MGIGKFDARGEVRLAEADKNAVRGYTEEMQRRVYMSGWGWWRDKNLNTHPMFFYLKRTIN